MTHKDFLQSLYNRAYALGVVDSQYEFGHLCGRKDSWLSSAKCADRPISIGALVSLAVSLERLPANRMPRGRERQQLKEFIREIWNHIDAKAVGEQ